MIMIKLRHFFLFSLLVPYFANAYDGQDKEKAKHILSLTKKGKPYDPIIDVDAKNNKKGKKTVYKDEYGVVVLINDKKIISQLKKYNSIAYPDIKSRPEITPHISIVQGVYRGKNLERLKKSISDIAHKTKSEKIELENKVVQGGGKNIFMDVDKGNEFFNSLNTFLTNAVNPDAPMKQVIDDITKGNANLKEMYLGGAWRDFNIPSNNRPHISVVYGKNNIGLIHKINKILNHKHYIFHANTISLFKIDSNGNLYGDSIYEEKLQ